jgi:hypothetical protein
MPGETPARVILGVAKVTISRPVVQGDGPATTAAAIPASPDNTTRNIITACTASVLAAFLFIFPIIWKRRRKKTQNNTPNQPPRR